jgi:GTP cyclohydrolase I
MPDSHRGETTLGEQNMEQLERAFELLIEGLGLDRSDSHLQDTPRRAAEAWAKELCAGLNGPQFRLTTFPVESEADSSMVALQQIPVKSICAHHLLPILGWATVAYVPNGQLCGLSKLSRVVDHFARRPQVQERLTNQIADFLQTGLHPQGVAVQVKASHMCMELRGVNHTGLMTTSTLRGVFREDTTLREEFMQLANNGK